MKRLHLSHFDLPLTSFEITRIHSKGDDLFGLMLPANAENPPMLVERNGFGLVVFPLSGPRSFERVQLGIGTKVEGIWFSEPRIAVDITSRVNPHSGGQVGDLSMSYGKVNLLTWDGRSDPPFPESYPTSIGCETGEANPVGFRRWSIFTVVEDREVEVWRREEPAVE